MSSAAFGTDYIESTWATRFAEVIHSGKNQATDPSRMRSLCASKK